MLCVLNALLMAAGQVLFKMGAKGKNMDSFTEIINVLISPVVILALIIYAATTILWLYILTKTPLSYAQPIQVLAIPTVVIISLYMFNEAVPTTRWIGIAIICIGVFIGSLK